jgi:D-alanyl-D-alanine carboxypeptidase (penicillin-binding protein 5/6)
MFKPRSRLFICLIVGLLIIGAYLLTPPKTRAISLPWPATAQAALGAQDYGVLESHNAPSPVPIASVAKVITALAILQKKPLTLGAQGPNLTLDATDVAFYNNYLSQDGSTAKVAEGEVISEYQALQALLIPSANNMADSLVRWAFGSPSAYVTYADQMLKNGGLTKTLVGDSSGFGDTTYSTADEIVKIGLAAMNNPVVSQIVSQPTATIPVAGEVKNVNWLLGSDGVVGIKTGNTEKAGGCYLVAANHQIAGQEVKLVAAVLDASDLNTAIKSADDLIKNADAGFEKITLLRKNQVVGAYKTAWGDNSKVELAQDLSILVWKGKDIKILNNLDALSPPAKANQVVSTISAESGNQSAKASLVLSKDLSNPPITWRLFR